uniref:Uncharacterized protein n=1 Tax=Desulfacinum infernum TaxID=35837 RepID=A0A832EEA3_9BACT
MIGRRKLLAIFYSEERLDYLSLVKGVRGWRVAGDLEGLPPHSAGAAGGVRSLEELLSRIAPQKSRHLHIGLAAQQVFFRDVLLPAMGLEEAVEAVRHAVPVACHLPMHDIFADVRLHRLRDKTIQGLVAYTPKKAVEGLLSVVAETGHEESLHGLFPVCLGWVAWLRQAVPEPSGVVCQDGGRPVLVAMDGAGRVHVVPQPEAAGGDAQVPTLTSVAASLGISAEQLFSSNGNPYAPASLENTLMAGWPHPGDNLASLTAAAAVASPFDFCLDGRAPRVRIFHPAKIVVPWIVLLAVTAWGLSVENHRKVEKLERKIQRVTATTRELEQQLEPLKKNVEEMKRVQTLLSGAAGFMEQRPKFYSFFNDLAERAPEGTWVSNVNFGDGQFVMQMVSPESLKTLEALRASPFVKEVQLRGAVNRRQDGKETFQVSIELKK